jgi:hypothetical protein
MMSRHSNKVVININAAGRMVSGVYRQLPFLHKTADVRHCAVFLSSAGRQMTEPAVIQLTAILTTAQHPPPPTTLPHSMESEKRPYLSPKSVHLLRTVSWS